MTTTDKSRADALKTIAEFPVTDRAKMDALNMRKIAADAIVAPVEQHEAAPAAEGESSLAFDYAHKLVATRLGATPPRKNAPSAPLEGTGNGADGRAIGTVKVNLARLDWGTEVTEPVLELDPDFERTLDESPGVAFKLYARAPRTEVAGAVLSDDARECLMDVVSHHSDFEKACRSLKDAASDDGNGSDASYWLHQIDVLDRMKAQADRALAPPSADAAAAPPVAKREDWQQKALDHGFTYWRAPDAHGVECTTSQAVNFLQDVLGVEVEIENAVPKDERAALAAALEAGRYTHASSNTEKHRAFKDGWNQAMTFSRAAFRQARAAASQPAAAAGQEAVAFQSRVQPWMLECFGAEIAADRAERNHRFLEEALELVQACGCTASEAHQLVDYTFGRPVGEPAQEAGGVMVTLAALCLANSLDMHAAGETELARVWTKVEQIRAKQAAKPKHSPLPEAAPPAQVATRQGLTDVLRQAREELGQVEWENDPPNRVVELFSAIDALLEGAKHA